MKRFPRLTRAMVWVLPSSWRTKSLETDTGKPSCLKFCLNGRNAIGLGNPGFPLKGMTSATSLNNDHQAVCRLSVLARKFETLINWELKEFQSLYFFVTGFLGLVPLKPVYTCNRHRWWRSPCHFSGTASRRPLKLGPIRARDGNKSKNQGRV